MIYGSLGLKQPEISYPPKCSEQKVCKISVCYLSYINQVGTDINVIIMPIASNTIST